jgi:hypothetical protein
LILLTQNVKYAITALQFIKHNSSHTHRSPNSANQLLFSSLFDPPIQKP